MTLLPWRRKESKELISPLSTLARLRNEMERMFDRVLTDDLGLSEQLFTSFGAWTPSIDVNDGVREISIRAEVPGVDPKDLRITVCGRTLSIAGEKNEATEKKEGGSYYSERRFGSFERNIELPDTADVDHISAEQENGVVTIHVPKVKGAEPKKVEVRPAKTSVSVSSR